MDGPVPRAAGYPRNGGGGGENSRPESMDGAGRPLMCFDRCATHKKEIVEAIFWSLYNPEWKNKIRKQLNDDSGGYGIWDTWRLESPSFAWHYRGDPHVHVWVNVADDPSVKISTDG